MTSVASHEDLLMGTAMAAVALVLLVGLLPSADALAARARHDDANVGPSRA